MLSIRDTAFALDLFEAGRWSLRASASIPVYAWLPGNGASLRALALRFSAAGDVLRSLAHDSEPRWPHLDRAQIAREISDRLRDPFVLRQGTTGLCGPISILVELVRRQPQRYVEAARQALGQGRLVCPSGRQIVAEDELRDAPVMVADIAQVDWLLAAMMRDDENIWEDVDDTANGLESITLWGEQRGWVRDVLDLPGASVETCFIGGEVDCMRQAERAVKAGGVAFFLIDKFLLKDGTGDDEEQARWQRASHWPRRPPSAWSSPVHSRDDRFPPDHWVIYLGGLELAEDPADEDPIDLTLWSWGGEYRVTATVGALAEYLYAVVTAIR